MRSKIAALGLLACSMWQTESSATVLNWGLSVENLTTSDVTFAFIFGQPTALSGPLDTRLSFGMAVGDGARNGAAVGLAFAPAIVQGSLGNGIATSTVATAGTAQSFAGEGGTTGLVHLEQFHIQNLAAAPTNFGFIFGAPLATTERLLAQSTLGRTFADGEVPNGGSIDASSNPDVMQARLLSGATADTTLDVGVDTAFPPDAGVFGPESASGLSNCDAGCDALEQEVFFQLSPLDLAGFIVRTELGGSELTGPVAWTTTAFDNAAFDCGATGCDTMEVLISFTLSPGDALTMVGRFDVEPAAVPEPATLAVIGLGLAGLGFARRRRAA